MTEFQKGTDVTWTHFRQQGKTIHFTQRRGKIIQMAGKMALCKSRAGHEWVGWESIRHVSQPGHITEMVMEEVDHENP